MWWNEQRARWSENSRGRGLAGRDERTGVVATGADAAGVVATVVEAAAPRATDAVGSDTARLLSPRPCRCRRQA